MAGHGDVVLESDTNVACFVILAYDTSHKVGGLAHALYFNGRMDKAWHSTTLRNTSEAIDEMISDMELIGADRGDIEISLVTGENVPHDQDDSEYQKNLRATLEIVRDKGIRFREDSVRDVGQQHVGLDVDSGQIIYK
jgi:chemotaxis receptor (MCP) glutamine deamidase CheD